MSQRDVLREPVWQAGELGQPIPDSVHAVSVALPRWQDVLDYEEKRPAVLERLRTGYPRFVVHPLVQEVGRRLGGGRPCLPFPSTRAANRCAEFIRRTTGEPAAVLSPGDLAAVTTTEGGSLALKAFWQHTGLIVSSRQAEAHLAGRGDDPEAPAWRASLRRQLAGWYGCAATDVYLAPTGMAAMLAALEAVRRRAPGRQTAQLGFPYVDTFKLQQKFGEGGHLLHDLGRIEADLTELLGRQPLAACFCEIPGNPLLGSADLRRITPILRQHRVPLVADDVVATPFNVDLSRHADLVATSLTKYVVGTGEAMGGAVICLPGSPYYAELKAILAEQHEELLWGADARVVEAQAHGFTARMPQHNANGLVIAERLRQHPRVERVWYPKWEFSEMYEAVRRPVGGWGSLVTFLPRQAPTTSPQIYDRLAVCKGPSLGTVFTLACPFTLLAHYTELAWAESCGVSRYLIRLSVGLEDPEDLWRRVEVALGT
ncbi:MAG: PLP-dependent transferase [Verrucomicrobia bacterium]|nr:PLP-dependent transferase [Verrucomicrobiota bacterium]